VVTVDEITVAVRVLLGIEPLDSCASADADGNGRVTVDEAVLAVHAALDGCTAECGNGIVEAGEECDRGTPDVGCYTDCTTCCEGAECIVSRCCVPEADGFVVFDPGCRECGEVGQGCGGTALLDFGCCGGLQCWDLSLPDPRLLQGTCCPAPGSPCDTADDCCGSNSFPWPSQPDACVNGTCCVQTGSVCHSWDGPRGPCCNPTDQCVGPTAVSGWSTCCTPGEDGACCVQRGGVCEAFGQALGACCVPGDQCAGVLGGGFLTCCAPSAQQCTESAECCSGVCAPAPGGFGSFCQ
jgi:hypothetical protein